MFRIDNLHVHYGLSHIIQGLTIEARPGEVVGIFGRNGVGKTTLLKAVAGWVRPIASAATASDSCRKTAASSPASALRRI
jgi:branched-chain amino acid transport system ATP-binding protein